MKTKDKVANAIKWIDGLLVTRYRQTEGQLGDKETGFCCLGYGCHVLEVDYNADDDFSNSFAIEVGLKKESARFEPLEVVGGYDYCSTLADLNDSAKLSFNQIAKFMISRDFSMFEDKVAAKLVEHYKKAQLAVDH